MSAAVSLPYFWTKMGGRTFEELFESAMAIDSGLAFLEQDVLVGHVDLARYSGDEAIRIALAIQEATIRTGPDRTEEALTSRLRWFIRDYCLVGPLVTEAASGQICTIGRAENDAKSDPYVYSVVLSALLRHGAISTEQVKAACEHHRLDLAEASDPGRVASALRILTDGTDSYRIYADHTTVTNGRDEKHELEHILALVQ